MALIGKIRRNMWLLVVPLALGLAGFIMMDMFSGQGSILGNNQMIVGEVDGEKINWPHFNRVEQVLYRNSPADVFTRRNTLWNYFVEESLVKEEAELLGLGVGRDELIDLHYGANPSPIIRQRFTDPTNGQLNRQQLNSLREQIASDQEISPEFRSYWSHQEQEVIKSRLQSKLNAIVSKALYTPTWIAEMGNNEFNQNIDFEYVKIPFDEIDNGEVPLENGDYQSFLDENKARFENKKGTRTVKFAVLDVLPTAKDTADLLADVNKLIEEFRSTPDDTLFVERNQGTFSGAFFTKDQLSPSFADTAAVIPVGNVFGPFIQNGNYNATKLIDRRMIADSADTRHILLNVDPANPVSSIQVEKLADSLLNLLETGAESFDSLAFKFSDDPGSKFNGGKYEKVTYGQFVPEYNDKIFLDGEIGKLYKIRSAQFGWHIVEVLGRSRTSTERYRVANINVPIMPSEETQRDVYDEAQIFVSENKDIESFINAVNSNPELSIETSGDINENDFSVGVLGANQGSRDIVRWAFSGKKGTVSPEIYAFQDQVNFFDNKYVVVALDRINPPGVPSVDQVKSSIELEVMNLKKGEKIKSMISGKNMQDIANEFSVSVDTLKRINFDQDILPQLGREPKIIAKAYTLEKGTVSEPIVGGSGVYVIKVIEKPAVTSDPNIPQLRQRISSSTRNLISGKLIESLKNKAEIEDNRSRFY